MRNLILLSCISILFGACTTKTTSTAPVSKTPQSDEAAAAEADAQQAIATQVPNTDIFIYEIDLENPNLITRYIGNATARPGYDNQPAFFKGSNDFVFSSIQDGKQSDIFVYSENPGSGGLAISQLTRSDVSEYSPTPVGDNSLVAVVVEQDGTQRLWQYGPEAEQRTLVRGDVSGVGYFRIIGSDAYNSQLDNHSWAALFIVDEPLRLDWTELNGSGREQIAINIGRALHQIPGSKKLSYVQHHEEAPSQLMAFDPAMRRSTHLVDMPDGVEDLAWLSDGRAVTVKDRQVLTWGRGLTSWTPVITLAEQHVQVSTRVAVNDSGTRLAIVAEIPSEKEN